MYKKAIYLVFLVLVLVLGSVASAATFQWDNGGGGNLWSVPENWDPDGLPGPDDEARIGMPDVNCVIDSSVAALCSTIYVGQSTEAGNLIMTGGSLTMAGNVNIGGPVDTNSVFTMNGGTVNSVNGRLWLGMSGPGTLIVNGGEMNIYDKIEIGKNANGIGTIYMNGGTLNFDGNGNSTDLEIGKYGTGAIYITGGVINVEDHIKLGQDSGSGSLHLYGGTINANNLRPVDQTSGSALIDITEGVLTLPGDYTAVVNEFINVGWMMAYGGLGEVLVVYDEDPNTTTVIGVLSDPELAKKPTPSDGKVDVSRTPVLRWLPGGFAQAHNVYFGTNFDDVNEASVDDPRGVLVSQEQEDNAYEPAGILDFNQTYYWRVDEVNSTEPNSPWKGHVWSFQVLNYIVVDDFEDYNDWEPDTIYLAWEDGFNNPANGSTSGYPAPIFSAGEHFVEVEVVHGGLQAYPYFYDNTAAQMSEATKSMASLSDWTQDNVVTLRLWYIAGQENNALEPMYAKLNESATVVNEDPDAAQAIEWTEWIIDLQAFADQGVNLANVTSMTIGFGDGPPGGAGMVIFDDIRLYRP